MSSSVALTVPRLSRDLPYVQRHDTPGETPEPDALEAARAQQIGEILGARETAHARREVGVGVAAREQVAEQRHDMVEPDPVEGRQQPARRRDLEDPEPAARAEHAPQLPDARLQVLDVPDAEADDGGVEARVVERQR